MAGPADKPNINSHRFVVKVLIVHVLFLAFLLWVYGLPIDSWSWFFVIGCAILSLPLLLLNKGRTAYVWIGLLLIVDLSFVWPLRSTNIMDVRGGRRGVKIKPWNCAFGKPGINTVLIERHIGHRTPQWRHANIRSMLIGSWRDGNERVNNVNPMFYEWLPDALAMLPDDHARKQVLVCLTDPGNLMRVHQGLLLACLNTKGYPPKHDAASWWKHHASFFNQEPDAQQAVLLTYGWRSATERFAPRFDDIKQEFFEAYSDIDSQRRAVRNQEHGKWGGDLEFGNAFRQEQMERFESDKPDEVPPSNSTSVVWWPDDPRFLEH